MTLLDSIFHRQLFPSPLKRGECESDGLLSFVFKTNRVVDYYTKRTASSLNISAFPFDFALNTFSCVRDDEYLVQRREVGV